MATKIPNVPVMNVNKVVQQLSKMYVSCIKNDLPFASVPSVMMWGAPGVGKSQAVRQIADEIKKSTGKKVHVTDVRLLLFNPIDLRGIPTANQDKTLAIWLRPQIFDMDDSKGVVNILFLDEISAAPQSVQAAAYQITLDRVVGEHKLPQNCIVIAAGNRVTDKSVAYKMPKALANRLLHLQVEGSFSSWKKWATTNGINAKVLGFLSFKQNYLMTFDENNDFLAFATPRTWEMASNLLNNVSDDVNEMYPLLSGILGTDMASEFKAWASVCDQLPDVEKIFKGDFPPVPKRADVLFALNSAMLSYAKKNKNKMDLIANSIRFADTMLPAEFSVALLNDYLAIEKGYGNKLMHLPEFVAWYQNKGGVIKGAKSK